MSFHSRVLQAGTIGAVALSLVGCAAGMKVNSFTEKGSDLGQYRTYRFGPSDTSNTGDPRLDDNRFFNERVQTDVDRMLGARGFEKAGGSQADLLVHYHASVTQQVEVNDSFPSDCVNPVVTGTPDPPMNCRPYVYDAGTLLIDLVDGRTKKLVWRGWAEGSIDGVLENQAWMEQRIDETVRRIFEKLPSRRL